MGGADARVGRTYPKNEADSEREDIEAEMKVRRVEPPFDLEGTSNNSWFWRFCLS